MSNTDMDKFGRVELEHIEEGGTVVIVQHPGDCGPEAEVFDRLVTAITQNVFVDLWCHSAVWLGGVEYDTLSILLTPGGGYHATTTVAQSLASLAYVLGYDDCWTIAPNGDLFHIDLGESESYLIGRVCADNREDFLTEDPEDAWFDGWGETYVF